MTHAPELIERYTEIIATVHGFAYPLPWHRAAAVAVLDEITRVRSDALEAARAEVERLTRERELDRDSAAAIRKMLQQAGVPEAAYIDDFVDNALAQRDQQRARAEKAERERDETQARLTKILDPTLSHLRIEGGKFNMALGGPLAEHTCRVLAEWFRESAAKNYIEMCFTARSEPFESYTVTVQKVGALTPTDKINAAAAAKEAAEAENAKLREALADAIRRPMGVVPDSAEGLVSKRDLAAAEDRRAARARAALEGRAG